MMIICNPKVMRGAHIFFQTIVLYKCNFVNCYDISTLQMISSCVFSGQRTRVLRMRVCWISATVLLGICHLSANAGIKCASALPLGWYRRGHCCGLLSPTLQDECLIISHFFWKRNYHGCIKMWVCQTGVVAPAQPSSSSLRRIRRSVVERDLSRELAWTWRADCVAFSVAETKSNVFFLWAHLTMQVHVCIPSRCDKHLMAKFQTVRIPTYLRALEKTLYYFLPSAYKLTETVSSTSLTTIIRFFYKWPCAM